jgi:8-oxo-dGTP pyrophosphatase MutT (NUDIX family)
MYEKGRTPFEMGDITDQESRGWKLSVDGIEIPKVGKLILEHPKFGKLIYGRHPMGYDTWIFVEIGGGGAVTIPYMIHPVNGMLYVGVVEQFRPLLGRPIWEVPRGFMDPSDKSKAETALREAFEELGYQFSRPILLADGKNPNSTFFDTSHLEDGVAFYGLPVSFKDLEEKWFYPDFDQGGPEASAGEHLDRYEFPRKIQVAAKGDDCEKIYRSRFVPIDRILYSPDLFSAAAAFYLKQFIEKKNAATTLTGGWTDHDKWKWEEVA